VMQSSRNGDYAVNIVGSGVGDDVSTRNGDGNNTIVLVDSGVAGDVIVSNRNGDNTIVIGAPAAPVTVGGRVSIRNGNGDNTLVSDDAEIGTDLQVRSGNAVTGNTTVIGTAAPVVVGRNLQLLSGNGGGTITLNAVDIGLNLSITTGDGDDTIVATGTALGDLTVGMFTSIQTDSGDDILQLGTDVAGVTDVSAGRVQVRMGGDADSAVIGEGTVIDILNSILDGGPGAPDVLTVVNGTAFDPFDPANAARLRNWELIVI
jgi:hypothetical protein